MAKNKMAKYKKIVVLMGGLSSEREVSLASGNACAKALETLGYDVIPVDVGHDIAAQLLQIKPDACFNALHGAPGEDGAIQGLLETMNIPYTHSGVTASAIAMDKSKTKTLFKNAGIGVADEKLAKRADVAKAHIMAPPYVIKPVADGSSVGIFLVKDDDLPKDAILKAGNPDDLLMVERYIPGRELTAAVMGDRCLGILEIVPKQGADFYDFEAKYGKDGSIHQLPDDLLPNIYQKIANWCLTAHQTLGCKGISRSDFRYDEQTNQLVCLEINTQPGMTETSLVPDVAKMAGIDFNELVKWIVEDASCLR